MSVKARILAFLGVTKPEPQPLIVHNLSRRQQRHEFIIVQVVNPHVFKVRKDGKLVLIDVGDWRFFKHELANYCQGQRIYSKALEDGTVQIHCIGVQENLPRGIKYTWRFNKL